MRKNSTFAFFIKLSNDASFKKMFCPVATHFFDIFFTVAAKLFSKDRFTSAAYSTALNGIRLAENVRSLANMKCLSITWQISCPVHTATLANISNMSPAEANINETFTKSNREKKA
jgi:hypothetical protein